MIFGSNLNTENTYVFLENQNLIGYVEIGLSKYYRMLSEFGPINNQDIKEKICKGIYFKYIYVDETYRNKGYGYKIANIAIEEASNRFPSAEVVSLITEFSNPMSSAAEKLAIK